MTQPAVPTISSSLRPTRSSSRTARIVNTRFVMPTDNACVIAEFVESPVNLRIVGA
jgi:hypothetical protein